MSWKKKKANSTCASTFLGARPPNSRNREKLNHLACQMQYICCILDYKTQLIEIMVDPSTVYISIMRFYCWTGDIQQLATGSIPKSKVAVSNFFRERPRSKYMIIFRYQSHLCWNCAWVCLKWSTSKNSLVSHHVSHQKLSLYAICKHIQKTNCWVIYINLDAKAKKKTILKHFLKGFLKGTLLAPK